jgi:hypothetical protein
LKLICEKIWGMESKNRLYPLIERLGPALLFLLVGIGVIWAALRPGPITLTDGETSQEINHEVVGIITPGVDLSQTFLARRSGLSMITLWLGEITANENGRGSLRFELFREGETVPFYTAAMSVAPSGAVAIAFPPQYDPPEQRYSMRLSTWEGEIEVLGRLEDAYPYGQAYTSGELLDADLAFRTDYRYDLSAALEDLGWLLSLFWLVLPLGVMLLLPGWLLLDLTGLRERFDGGEQAAIAIALSLAVIPLVMLWTSLAGMSWSVEIVFVGGALLVGALVLRWLRRPVRLRWSWSGFVLVIIFVAGLYVRLAMVRDLAGPAWVDSVHHSLITRLIQEIGGYPETYAPYFGLDPTQYHPGFHSGLAIFTWLSGLALPESLLLYGQILNAAAAPAVYLLASTLTRDRSAAVIAALLTAFVTPMPAYYTSWGRYTQLAGLLILPAALPFVRMVIEERELPWLPSLAWLPSLKLLRPLLPAALALTGLLLVHYRVAAFAALLLAAYVLTQLFGQREDLKALAARSAAGAIVLILGPLLLAGPWIWPALTSHIIPSLHPSQAFEMQAFDDFSWRYLTAGLGSVSLWLASLGLVLGLIHQERFIFTIALWTGLLFLLANLGALGLPGGWLVNNTSVAIALFMPVSVLGGYAGASLLESWHPKLPAFLRRPFQSAIAGGLVVLAFLGGRELIPILNPQTELLRAADRVAMEWIQTHIPEEEIIIVNPFNWGYGVYAGRDGGYWISPLTGRRTMPPPVLYGMGERAEVLEISALAREASEAGSDPEALYALLEDHGIRYLYIGVRGGPFSPAALKESPLFWLLYEFQGGYVFERADHTGP